MTSDPHHKLARRAGIFTGATMLSRILGYFRDTMVAAYFGAGPAADAFYTAVRISNLLRRLVGAGAWSPAFVPGFSEGPQTPCHPATPRVPKTVVAPSLAASSVVPRAATLLTP